MPENGHNQDISSAPPQVKRFRASGPILLLAVLFVVGAFLTWYFTWFGRELNDADIATYLVDTKHPRKVQHALLQIQHRIERRDATAKQWYPQILLLVDSPETEARLTVAWLMGFDRQSAEFHQSLLRMLKDPEPIVRRNAALALVRHKDAAGRSELLAILAPYAVLAPAAGVLSSSLNPGATVARGSLLARIQNSNNQAVELRSPLRGTVESLTVASGAQVTQAQEILTLAPDEESVWETLRGLALIGEPDDVPVIQNFLQRATALPDRTKEQAALTVKAIESRK